MRWERQAAMGDRRIVGSHTARPGLVPRVLAFLALPALLAAGCQTPLQRVPVHLEPADARVFVDGTELVGPVAAVELRSDRPHVVLAKRDGYRALQLVLEPQEVAGVPRLEPSEIRMRLEPLVPMEREFHIEASD